MKETEFRTADLLLNQEQKIEGYAAVYNSETKLYENNGIDYYEVVDKGAFDNADMSNVVLRYNHNDTYQILARTENDTLKLNVDEKGLHIEADIANTNQGQDIYTLIKRKDITKMSYAYVVAKDYIEKISKSKYIRHIKQIRKIIDVSVVDFPAYDDTVVFIKNKVDIFNENLLKEQIKLKAKL